MPDPASTERYSYLGPAGTFTWAALTRVPEAQGKEWVSVNNVGEALHDVVSGRSVGAVIPDAGWHEPPGRPGGCPPIGFRPCPDATQRPTAT